MRKKVPWMKKAEDMFECVAVLDNGPLQNDNFELFYTAFQEPYRKDIVQQLEFKLGVESPVPRKYILAGHRGVGKSTELLRVSRLCTEYETVFINSADASGPKGTGYTNLLVLITDKVIEYGVKHNYLEEDDAAFESLLNYWDSELQIKKTVSDLRANEGTVDVDANIGGSISTSFSMLNKLKTIITVGAKLGVQTKKRNENSVTVDETIHTIIDNNDMLFVQALNTMLVNLKSKMNGKHLLIIVEDLDKAGQFELAADVFNNHFKPFVNIEADMIYTYPVHLQYDPEYSRVYDIFSDVYKLGVVELLNGNMHYDSAGIAAFKGLIYKRISEDLISDDALTLAIKMSGGLIRDVFSMLSEAAVIAGINKRSKIAVSDVESAIRTLEDRYIKMIKVKDAFNMLVEIYNKPHRQIDAELRELLRAEAVLEYSGNRYIVHPVVVKFLHDLGMSIQEYDIDSQ